MSGRGPLARHGSMPPRAGGLTSLAATAHRLLGLGLTMLALSSQPAAAAVAPDYYERLAVAIHHLDRGNCADAERILRALYGESETPRQKAERSAELAEVELCKGRSPCAAVELFRRYFDWARGRKDVDTESHRAWWDLRDQALADCAASTTILPPRPVPGSPARTYLALGATSGVVLADDDVYRANTGLDLTLRRDLNGPPPTTDEPDSFAREDTVDDTGPGPRVSLDVGAGLLVETPRVARVHLGMTLTDREPADGGPRVAVAAVGWLFGPATGVGARGGLAWIWMLDRDWGAGLGADATYWPAGDLVAIEGRLELHHAF